MKVTIIGAGSWGTAVAVLLAQNGHNITLWARRAEFAQQLTTEKKNEDYLPGIVLSDTINATSDLEQAMDTPDALVLAMPSNAVRDTCKMLVPYYDEDTPALLLSKGLDLVTGMTLFDVVDSVLENRFSLAVLSGPNHAEEVARGVLSATVVAAEQPDIAEFFQDLLVSPTFRVYTSSDIKGVAVCGAAKNIIAIAAGIIAGKGFGDNTAAMLMTRGLAEISRLVEALGGKGQTCMGLAGMGDLIVTCTSRHSRNRSFGEALAAGETLQSYEAKTHMVVEGALACKSVALLASHLNVEMPICEMVRRVVWEDVPQDEMIEVLMARPAKPEFE